MSLIHLSDPDADEEQDSILMPSISQTETEEDINLSECSTREQIGTALSRYESFTDVLTDIPGTTTLVEHKVIVTSSEPIRALTQHQLSLPKRRKEQTDFASTIKD